MNFEEVMVQILANRKNRVNQLKVRATMDHQLANLMAFALNDPSKMPKLEEAYPFLKDEENKTEQIPQWKINQLKMMARAKQIKRARKNIKEGSE